MLDQNTIKLLNDLISASPKALADLIKSGEVSKIVDDISLVYSLSPEQVALMENKLLLIFIGSLPISQLQPILLQEMKLPEDKVFDILDDLAATLLNGEALRNLLALENEYWPKDPNKVQIASEIAETEAALNSINPIRTMATDSGQPLPATDPTYSSMQSAILREGKGQQTNSPRWDSEN